MVEALRTCPACLTRVLPTPEGSCPACRKHKFDFTSDSRAAAAVKVAQVKSKADLYEAAVLYWRTWKLMGLQWSLTAVYFGLRAIWPGDPSADASVDTIELVVGVLILAAGVVLFLTTKRLGEWLDPGGGAIWATVSAVPAANVLALLRFTKEVATEFENRGVVIRGLGPRLSDLERD
jgi:hypothetical protein